MGIADDPADPGAIDLGALPDLLERLRDLQEWEKTGRTYDLLTEAIVVIEALRERVEELEGVVEQASDRAFAKKFDEWANYP